MLGLKPYRKPMRTLAPRKKKFKEIEPVYRTPEQLSDLVYLSYNQLVHRASLSDGCPVFASRMIREEHFTVDELLELRRIMTDEEAPTTEISREILGGRETLSWIDSIIGA
jgi:hypothetical protein